MTEEETRPLLDFLTDHATRYEFVYRHKWSLHDLIMWDNRCALHYAVPDFDRSQMRWMQRCTLLGPETGRVSA
jgi:taurine dioxygenase